MKFSIEENTDDNNHLTFFIFYDNKPRLSYS